MLSTSPTTLITGASSGIGSLYAKRLAARGHALILVARRAERLEALAAELADEFGVTVRFVTADLTAEADISRLEQMLRSETVDMLVNNAGMGPIRSTVDMSDADAVATLSLNVAALMRLTRAVLPGMLARGTGTIVNVASVLAFGSFPVTSLYSATKAFVLSYSQGIAQEVKGTDIFVQAVLPAGTVTEFYETAGVPISNFDASVFMTAEQLVDAALLGLDRGEEVTLPSVHDLALWDAFEEARSNLFAGTQNGSPAPRYLVA